METSPSILAKKFDVFLSFRGEDTRNNFTGHLSLALRKIGLFNIFKDDYALDKGKDIGPELMKVIEDSEYAVVVLSENYATSSWCLKELAKIVECMGDSGRIRTIFYHVNPSHVRNVISTDEKEQKESSFWKALEEHAKNPTHSQDLEKWRMALVKVANQSGQPLEAHTDEAIFIKNFVADISSKIGASIRTIEGLFGMVQRLKQIDSFVLDYSTINDVCFIGIHGMGGIGKTTLAEAYFVKMSHKFEGSSFLTNVRESCEKQANGLLDLQRKLLKDILEEDCQVGHVRNGINLIRSRLRAKKVLVIVDDVDNPKQLEALADSHRKKQGSKNELDIWFGPGSVVIVTTRNENLLRERYKKYRAEYLDDSEALRLFSWKAFESIEPPEEFKELSKEVVKYASNLPLALTVLGSLLGPKEKNLWESALCRLRKFPEKEIVGKLKISFDDLDEVDQRIFLDIACFFRGHEKTNVIQILDGCGFNSEYGISNLSAKSLLSITEDDTIWVHDLLEEMAKNIVRKESGNESARQSRIWNEDDLYQILENKEGTSEVEGINIHVDETKEYSFEALSSMKKLRILMIFGLDFDFDYHDGPELHVDDCVGPELSNVLGCLQWRGFPYNKFPSSFQPRKLVQLNLGYSKIKQLWNNFAVVPNLQILDLCFCEKLSEIHPSIERLKRLVILDLKFCTSLKKLPEEINGLASLQRLTITGCSKVEKLPDNLEPLKNMTNLQIYGSGIKHFPSSIFLMKKLEYVYCEDERMIKSAVRENIISYRTTGKCFISDWFCSSLSRLNLSDCNLTGPKAFPEYFGKCFKLRHLDLSKNPFSVLPHGISGLYRLKTLRLEHCKCLRSLEAEVLPSSLRKVNVSYCTSLASFLDPRKPCHLSCSAYCLECPELVRRQDGKLTALASLSRFLEDTNTSFINFKFVVPQSGCALPSWFINQSPTPSNSIKLHPRHHSKLMGFAMVFCCFRANLSCDIIVATDNGSWTTIRVGVTGSGTSDHLFLLYKGNSKKTRKFLHRASLTPAPFEFSFRNADEHCLSCGPWGARLVYEEDKEELKKITRQSKKS